MNFVVVGGLVGWPGDRVVGQAEVAADGGDASRRRRRQRRRRRAVLGGRSPGGLHNTQRASSCQGVDFARHYVSYALLLPHC